VSTIRCTPSPYTPASRFSKKQTDPEFRTKLQIAADLVTQARSKRGTAPIARVEDRIRCAKQAGLGRLPSRVFAINQENHGP
jgi:hypothetical protein